MENNKQIQLIQEQSFSLPDEATHITITDDQSLREANNFYQACKQIVANIHRHMDPVRDSNYKSWKESINLINKLEELPKKAMGITVWILGFSMGADEKAFKGKENQSFLWASRSS